MHKLENSSKNKTKTELYTREKETDQPSGYTGTKWKEDLIVYHHHYLKAIIVEQQKSEHLLYTSHY